MTATAIQIAPCARRPAAKTPAAVPAHISVRSVRFRDNGVEFLSSHPLPMWAELRLGPVTLESAATLEITGVVVGCHRRGKAWQVSLLFLGRGGSRGAREIQWLAA
jgi:hypothetical protein